MAYSYGGGGRIAVYYTTNAGFSGFTRSHAAGYGSGGTGVFFDQLHPTVAVCSRYAFPVAPTLHYETILLADGAAVTLGDNFNFTVDHWW